MPVVLSGGVEDHSVVRCLTARSCQRLTIAPVGSQMQYFNARAVCLLCFKTH